MKKLYPSIRIFSLAILAGLLFTFDLSAQIIASHPRNVTECEGTAEVAFAVSINKGYTGVSYTWQYAEPGKLVVWKDVPSIIASGTEKTSKLVLTFDKTTTPLTTALNKSQYRCKVTGLYLLKLITEYSNSAYLYVYAKPSITGNPASATKNVGESVTFSVSASSSLTKSYQWQKNNVNISGATSSSLTLSNLALTDAANYRCRVSNTCGYVYSNNAVLTVNGVEYDDGWFEQASPTSQDIRKVDAVDRYNAWAVTADTDRLLKTTDGGETWSSVQTGLSSPYWQSVDMISSTTIYAGGYNKIGKTTNGGTNWTEYNVYTSLGLDEYVYIYGIQFLNSTTGYAVGRGGIIIKTTDGGTTWVKQNWKNDALPVTDVDLKDLHFIDVNTGWAVGYNGVILKTTNGGSSWTKLPSYNSTNLNSVYFVSASVGYATGPGYYRHLIKTTDGGTTWTGLSDNMPAGYPWDVHFVDSNSGYVTGQIYNYNTLSYEGSVIKTNDGGVTWYTQKVIGANQLYDIYMIDSEDGWTVGDAGEIQRTASGGCFTPSVNLYADVEFCASGSHTMVADTFSTNLNCSYDWNTGSTAGQLTVNETGTYSVTVTSLCGVTATDALNINVFPLPEANAGEDVTICDGDSTQLIATGGVSFLWNHPGYLDYDDIQNPLASPPVGSTAFIVSVTDENGCEKSDEVIVHVNPIPTSTFTAPGYTCGNADVSFSHTGTSGIDTYFWSFEDSLTSTGATGGNPVASWDPSNLGDKHISLVVEKDGCYSDTTNKILEVRVVPTADFEAPLSVCGSDAAVLTYSGTAPSDAIYNWSAPDGTISGSGQGPLNVNYATGGIKNVSLEVIQNACSSGTQNKNITVGYPFEGEKICIVTVDLESGKNMVVWNKTEDAGIASYNVYRLGTGGNYNLLGNVSFDEFPSFVDMAGEPEKTQYLYKISAVDTCGNESSKSHYHKTLFLQYTNSDGGVNLLWQDYEIEDEVIEFSDFNIYRGSDSTDLVQIDVVSGSNVYTDTDAGATSQKMYYRVAGVLPEPCDPAGILGKKAEGGPFVHSLSNLEDNKIKTGISDALAASISLQLYPNPFSNNAMIHYNLRKEADVRIEIYNMTGQKLRDLYQDRQYAGAHEMEIKASDLNNVQGLYYVRIHIDNNYTTRKLVLK